MSFQAWKSLYPLISLDYFQKSGRSILDDGFNEIKNEKTEVQFLPLGIGVKYVHRVISRVDLYGTLGATATYLHIKDDYENRSHVFANWGPGFTVKLGSLVTINKGLFLDFALEYFYARVHFSKPLIPAHLDGIALGGGAGYRF
ncbi:MAG TPA: hypothetical protein VLE96_01395 [Chlamydiales bacterium]|nr:hypothetical protein [Chlamydiales bacterium]